MFNLLMNEPKTLNNFCEVKCIYIICLLDCQKTADFAQIKDSSQCVLACILSEFDHYLSLSLSLFLSLTFCNIILLSYNNWTQNFNSYRTLPQTSVT